MNHYPNLFIQNTIFVLNDITKDTNKINKIKNELTTEIDIYKKTNIVDYNNTLKNILINGKYFPMPKLISSQNMFRYKIIIQ